MTPPVSPQKRLLDRLGVSWLAGGNASSGPTGSKGPVESPPVSPVKRKITAGEGLESVFPEYQVEESDTLDLELRALPLNFSPTEVESLAEARTTVLEAVSERLSEHVLRNYNRFVDGVRGVTVVQADVEAAHSAARISREALARALGTVSSTIRIASDTERKAGLAALLRTTGALSEAAAALGALRSAIEEGQYAEAATLRRRCAAILSERVPSSLRVRRELERSVGEAGESLRLGLSDALAAICLDFQPKPYKRILLGLLADANCSGDGSIMNGTGLSSLANQLDNSAHQLEPSLKAIAHQVTAAYLTAARSISVRVVRGVLLTRSGSEERAHDPNLTLPDLVRALPSDLFRTALARLLQVLFDMLTSHWRMTKWHEGALEEQSARIAALQDQLAKAATDGDNEKVSASPPERRLRGEEPVNNGDGHQGGRMKGESEPSTDRQPANIELDTLRNEVLYGSALRAVHAALLSGRTLVWEEVARRVSSLLSSPAAFEGEHFLQVIDSMQHFVSVGEAFSGVESASLRALLQRQSANFFAAFHASNVEALDSMLSKEAWTRLPVELPGLLDALRGGGRRLEDSRRHDDHLGSSSSSSPTAFEAMVLAGNPWRTRLDVEQTTMNAPKLDFGGTEEEEEGLITNGASANDNDNRSVPATYSSSSDAEEVHGDYIDEESQSVRRRGEAPDGGTYLGSSTNIRAHGSAAPLRSSSLTTGGTTTDPSQYCTVTNSSWRAMKWMRDYARLMCTLRPAAPAIFAGLVELHDLYLLHVAACFDPQGILRVDRGEPLVSVEEGDAGGFQRLEATLRRILKEGVGSLPTVRSGGGLAAALSSSSGGAASHLASSLPWFHNNNNNMAVGQGGPSQSQPTLGGSTTGGASAGSFTAQNRAPTPTALVSSGQEHNLQHQASIVSSGNMYGLVERMVASASLSEIGRRIAEARSALSSLLAVGESHAVEAFFAKSPGAVEELRERIMHVGVNLLLNLQWLPDAVGSTSYSLAEPPTEPQAWASQLLRQLKVFADRVRHASGLGTSGRWLAWQAAIDATSRVMLVGVSRVKASSLEGRAALTLDVQSVEHGLRSLTPKDLRVSLATVDAYVKAFYIPLGELGAWSQLHPEYSKDQVLALAACMAESSGLRRKEKAAVLTQLDVVLTEDHR